jgi:hypothetical protein
MANEVPGGAPAHDDRDDLDREVSRQVRNPTRAEPDDDAAYRAADPVPDDEDRPPGSAELGGDASADAAGGPSTGPSAGGSTERAAAEVADAGESEPGRSE